MPANKTRMQTTLVVDNLSPFTPDIVTCLNKLGANYIQKSFSSITNVTISSNDDNNSSNYKYYGHNPGGNAFILNKNKVLSDGATYDKKKNNNDSRDIIDTNNNTNKTNNT